MLIYQIVKTFLEKAYVIPNAKKFLECFTKKNCEKQIKKSLELKK